MSWDCPSFKDTNEYEVLNAIRREKLVDWVGIHPQLCSTDGDEYLKTLLSNSNVDELYVAGCDPVMQKKMFRDAFDAAGFDRDKHIGIEVWRVTRHGLESKIEEKRKNKR